MRDARAHGQPAGSLGEEAVKLLSAMSAWAEEHSTTGPSGDTPPRPAGGQAAGRVCQWCPHCQVAAKVRSASPELREQLVLSGLALTSAARALLETLAAPPVREPAAPADVERIDLSDEKEAQPWD
jgi:hypothetical protein